MVLKQRYKFSQTASGDSGRLLDHQGGGDPPNGSSLCDLCGLMCQPGASQVARPDHAGDEGDVGLIPGSGRSPERRRRQPTPVFFLEYPKDRGV